MHACAECGLAGWGVVRIPWDEIPERRRDPGPAGDLKPAPHLKFADDQTVVACAAVLNACERADWAPSGFGDWGVLAAPTYLGRSRLAPAFRRFRKTGARGMSPLIIPTMSNHAVAGTLCLIMNCHGPNFGIGSATPTVDELLLNGLSLLNGRVADTAMGAPTLAASATDRHECPGVWAVMTAWTPEPIPDDDGQSTTPAVGIGVALALVPGTSSGAVRFAPTGFWRSNTHERGTVFELADFLEQPGHETSWFCPILGGGHLELIAGAGATSAIPLRLAG